MTARANSPQRLRHFFNVSQPNTESGISDRNSLCFIKNVLQLWEQKLSHSHRILNGKIMICASAYQELSGCLKLIIRKPDLQPDGVLPDSRLKVLFPVIPRSQYSFLQVSHIESPHVHIHSSSSIPDFPHPLCWTPDKQVFRCLCPVQKLSLSMPEIHRKA